MRVYAHASQRSTCPPRAAVRQLSIADITLSWPRLRWPAWARRHAAPWSRKISATSSAGRDKSRALGGRLHRRDQLLERAGDLTQRLEGDARIERRRIELLVPEQHLDHPDVGLLLEQVRRKAMPQRVQRDGLVELRHHRRRMAGTVELTRCERVDRVLSGK